MIPVHALKKIHLSTEIENEIFQEVDARICSEKCPKTPNSLQMIAPGTQSSFWTMFLNGF